MRTAGSAWCACGTSSPPRSCSRSSRSAAAVFGWAGGTSQALSLSPDGTTLAAGGSDNTVRLWDLASGKELHPDGGHQGSVSLLLASEDGKTLTSWGSDHTVRRWETATG